SDDRYFEDFGRSLSIAATTLLPSSAYFRGQGSWWKASVGGDEYQITDPTLSVAAEPYRRLPRATFDADHSLLGNLDAGIRSEYVSFSKDNAVDAHRLDLYPYLAMPIERAAWFVRPELGFRYTSYQIDRDADKSPHRGTPIASVDAGLRFERALDLGGSGYTQTLEPRAYYLRVPYRDQDNLPLFDTQEVPFSFGQLFRSNRFVGADRQMDANNLTLALTSRLIEDSSGSERVSASIGQIRYFDDQRVQLPGRAGTDFNGSTYVGELDLRINERWRATFSNQWNPNSDRTELSAVGIQNRFGNDGVFNVSYRFRRNLLEQADASVLIPLNPSWRLVGRWNYSMFDRKTLEAFAGIEHDSCCIAWRLLARRYVHNIERDMSNALYFEVEFKGVGSLGQKTGDFLRRAILGYQ
ncbi:MAG TPA: LPS assembly protein LptD, partial [Dokdonella sp.]|nr:LPS assembly protein LptD [Dokdonella sp.]HQY55046.1 LPS assembly protein LptD [Dokdonella sp.]